MNEEVRHFSLRKLSVGLASVLVGVSIFGASQTVKADTVADQTASAVTNNTQSSDTQENKNASESSFLNEKVANNAKSNATQTQENEPKQVQAENVRQDSAPKTQETTDNKDLGAEKSATRASSLQEPDNQSNTVIGKTVQHDTLESGQKAQSFNLPKNSQKFNRKVLATNLSEATSSPMTNGGFDEATWGKLDVNNWHGSVQDGVYQLTGYTGDEIHIIVPNEADFEKAGKSTNGLQVGITSDTVQSLLTNYSLNHAPKTIAFSKTNDQKVKAIGTDWSHAFSRSVITNFDGSNLDVSGVTNMSNMFGDMHLANEISDLSSLANWNTSKVTDMSNMFIQNKIGDLSPLTNWDTSNVTNMSNMFAGNKISDLTGLANWDVSNVTDMSDMFNDGFGFGDNKISNLTPLANWDVSNVTNMRGMFAGNKVSDLTPLKNWDMSKVTDMSSMFLYNGNISDLAPLTNWDVGNVTNMRGMFASNSISDLTPLTNWDTSKVTSMSSMFAGNKISNLTGLTNWNTSKVTDMSNMFKGNSISDLAPLTNWNTSKVTNMNQMFEGNKISNLTPLTNWDTSKVTNMNQMFAGNKISNLTPLTNWDTSKVTSMRHMFAQNPDIKDLKPIANRDMRSVAIMDLDGIFEGDAQLDLTDINNTQLVQDLLKIKEKAKDTSDPSALRYRWALRHILGNVLRGTTFVTNNADLVDVIVGQKLPVFTKTAKRTIVFHFPDGTQKEIDQIINFKTIAPVQIEWPAPTRVVSTNLMTVIRPVIRSGGVIYNPVQAAIPRIIKRYTIDDVKASDWQLDTSQTKPEDVNVVNGRVYFKSVPIPHINGYKAYIVPNKPNPAMLMVSFMAVPSENKPSTPVEVAPSKPSAPADNPNKPADDLQKHVAAKLNSNDLGWTMPVDISNSTYTVEVPKDATIDLSDLVIAEPVHAQTRTQIRVNKRFKLSKKHVAKHLKHRKRVSKLFSKRFKLSKKHAIKHLKHRKRVSKLFSKRYSLL